MDRTHVSRLVTSIMRRSIVPLSLLALVGGSLSCHDGSSDPSTLPPDELVQSGCDVDDHCEGGRCIAGIGEGLCTANCEIQDDCPDGTICTDTEAVGGVCLLACDTATECTDHLGPAYTCDQETDLTTGEDVWVCIDSR